MPKAIMAIKIYWKEMLYDFNKDKLHVCRDIQNNCIIIKQQFNDFL